MPVKIFSDYFSEDLEEKINLWLEGADTPNSKFDIKYSVSSLIDTDGEITNLYSALFYYKP